MVFNFFPILEHADGWAWALLRGVLYFPIWNPLEIGQSMWKTCIIECCTVYSLKDFKNEKIHPRCIICKANEKINHVKWMRWRKTHVQVQANIGCFGICATERVKRRPLSPIINVSIFSKNQLDLIKLPYIRSNAISSEHFGLRVSPFYTCAQYLRPKIDDDSAPSFARLRISVEWPTKLARASHIQNSYSRFNDSRFSVLKSKAKLMFRLSLLGRARTPAPLRFVYFIDERGSFSLAFANGKTIKVFSREKRPNKIINISRSSPPDFDWSSHLFHSFLRT